MLDAVGSAARPLVAPQAPSRTPATTSTTAPAATRARPVARVRGCAAVPTRDVGLDTGRPDSRRGSIDTGVSGTVDAIGLRSIGERSETGIFSGDAMKTRAAGEGSSPYSARYTRFTASRIVAALGQRAGLWNDSARSTISATAGGTSGSTDPSGRALRVADRTICSCGDVAG